MPDFKLQVSQLDSKFQVAQPEWPNDPYKGLTYYSSGDVPLFAGRETDVRRVAQIVGVGSTRILLLHGPTGCGKSSFLRAGLIPFLETQIGRFHFAQEESGGISRTLFVRATYDPLLELAVRTYEGANETRDLVNAECDLDARSQKEAAPKFAGLGPEKSGLSKLALKLKEYPTPASFTSAVADDPERLVEMIGLIGSSLPRTQVLVVDQAEEVLTLRPGSDGDAARLRFFLFLAYLSRSAIDFRLIVAFRTEYHGRFYAMLRAGRIDATAVEDYYLAELAKADILEAILRPCSPDEIPRYGIPRKKYKFYYEDGLPEMIATDLAGTPLTGGSLPVLQIVCRRLYQKARTSPPVRGNHVIRAKDYRYLGGIQGQVDSHLQEALVRCCDEFQLRHLPASLETMRWRDVLSALAKPQADGSITTDVKPEKKLEELAHSKGCKMKVKKVMEVLGRDEWRIVRFVELTKVTTNEKVPCFSLGHDVLGAVLERWSEGRKRDRSGLRQVWLSLEPYLSVSHYCCPNICLYSQRTNCWVLPWAQSSCCWLRYRIARSSSFFTGRFTA